MVRYDNDPYNAFDYNKEKFLEIGSTIVVINNARHFTGDGGFIALPQIFVEFEKMNR